MLRTSDFDSYTILWLQWSIGSIAVSIAGLLVLNYSNFLPNFVHRTVKYGKSAEDHGKLKFLELPKRLFFHFYALALVFYLFLGSLVINMYFNINLFDERVQMSSTVLRQLLDRFTNYDYLQINYQRVASGKLMDREWI